MAGPNAVRLGALPSSCHVIEYALPAGILVAAVGLVILKGYESEIVGKSVNTDENVRMGERSKGSKRKNEERGKHC